MGKSLILAVKIIGEARSAVDALDKTASRADKLRAGWNKVVAASAIVVGALVGVGKVLENAGEAANTSRSRIENIATQMGFFGDETGAVTDRLVDLANEMALKTAIDPNSIKQAQATLMTFQDIGKTANEMGGVFDRATQASADLAGAGFGTIESASVMLGKALGDPTRGLTALNRVGVQFNETEREQIKALQEAGDMMAAQEIILQGVERQVGGTAEATADASEQQKIAWQLAREEIGLKLLPVFEQLREYGIEMAGWVAENSDLVIGLAAGIGALAAGVLVINGAMKVYAAIQAVQTAAQWANNAAWLASPVTWIVIAVVAAIAILVTAVVLIVKNWDTLKAAAVSAWQTVVSWVQTAISWLGDRIMSPIRSVMATFQNLKASAINVFQSIINWVKNAIDWIANLASRAVPGWAKDLLGMSGFSASMSITPEIQSFAMPSLDSIQPFATEGLIMPMATPAPPQVAPMATTMMSLPPSSLSPVTTKHTIVYEDKRTQNFNFPNYTGDREELIDFIEEALRRKDREDNGLVKA